MTREWDHYRDFLVVLDSSEENLTRQTQTVERDLEQRSKQVHQQFERSFQSIRAKREDLQNQLERARLSLEKISDPRFQLQKSAPPGKHIQATGPMTIGRNVELSALAMQIEEAVVALTQTRRTAIAARRKLDEDENRRRLDEAERVRRESEIREKRRAKRLKLVKATVLAVVITAVVGVTIVLR